MRRTLPMLLILGVLAVPASGRAQGAPNVMHPAFPLLDANGQPVLGTGAAPSPDKTCGACHDAPFIDAHNSHLKDGRKATCVECHFEGSRLPTDPAAFDEHGLLKREFIRISAPRDQNCAFCHCIVHAGTTPVSIPDDFEAPAPGRTYALTRDTGEILSPQDVSASWLNLKDRDVRSYPWDVHARRLVGCTSCHFAPNSPARAGVKHTVLDFLRSDPRRITVSQFLHRPDHNLVTASCRSCHDPLAVHEFLPYKERHLAALDCRSCHAATLSGPAAQAVDATVVLPGGGPRVEYRGMTRAEGESLNTAFTEGYAPFLLARPDPIEGTKLAPFNLVTRWSWASGTTGDEVPAATVKAAWLDGGQYATEVVRALDADGNGRLEPADLRLDTPPKIAAIRSRLATLGVSDPQIRAAILPRPVNHGILAGANVRRDCANCHADRSVLDAPITLSSFTTGGVLPLPPDGPGAPVTGTIRATEGGGLVLDRKPSASFYVFGHSRDALADLAGLLAFSAVVIGVAVHGGLRVRASRKNGKPHPAGPKVYLYSTYERVWHWLMAFSILALMVTGFEIHSGRHFTLLGLPVAVKVHNFFALVMVVNAFLSLFYHLASSAIRQFLPPRENLVGEMTAQARYYLQGIFVGQPHPTPKSAARKLNPLQQVTYLALLNVLFPFQVVTGVLIWGASRWPDFATSLGGLTIIAPLHDLGSWLFLTFFVLHLYLTTTGRTVLSNVRAMVDGWEELDAAPHVAEGGPK